MFEGNPLLTVCRCVVDKGRRSWGTFAFLFEQGTFVP